MTGTIKFSSALLFVSVASLLLGAAHAASDIAEPVEQRASPVPDALQQRLEREENSLNIDRQRGLRARQYDIAPDVRKFEQMQLDQRLEHQRFDRQQAQRDLELRRDSGSLPPELLEQRAALQQQIRAQERQIQFQRFEMDRERQLQLLDRGPFLPPLTGTPPRVQFEVDRDRQMQTFLPPPSRVR